MMSKFFIRTLGCRLNQAESQVLEQILLTSGWKITNNIKKANWFILNTCVVTEKAEKETRQTISWAKRENPKVKIAVAGCWVDKMAKFGGIKIERIELMLRNEEKWRGEKFSIFNFQFPNKPKIINLKYKNPARRLVKVQSGCNNKCTYCLPRLLRGKSKSVPIKKVISKVNQALAAGALEIVLTGQNITQYEDKNKDWLDLIEIILRKTKTPILRLGSINPDFDPKRLVEIYRKYGKNRLARHFHISLQSGSDRILKLMGRNYTAVDYFNLIKNLKSKILNLQISTDIIAGFSGETEEDFQKTLSLCRRVGFGKIHVFRYSSRPGTPAAKLKDINQKIKIKRVKALVALSKKLEHKFRQENLGKETMAVIWKTGRGLSENYLPIKVKTTGLKLPGVFRVEFVSLKNGFVEAGVV